MLCSMFAHYMGVMMRDFKRSRAIRRGVDKVSSAPEQPFVLVTDEVSIAEVGEANDYELQFCWRERAGRGASHRIIAVHEDDWDMVLDQMTRRNGGMTRVARALARNLARLDGK